MTTKTDWKLGNLSNCNLDTANYKLRNGYASEEEAKNYVKMWNACRTTGARLRHRSMTFCYTEMKWPEIVIFDR